MILENKRIIITGAGAGIGLGVVKRAVAAGARVIGFDKSDAGKKKLSELGTEFIEVDVSNAAHFSSALEQASRQMGGLDGLVNNAGITINVPFLEMTLPQMEMLWQINQRSVLVACQKAAQIMIAQGGGSIVNIASNHAKSTDAGYEGYAGTKAAIVAMTRAMAWSLGDKGIRINALSPGLTKTEIVGDAMKEDSNAATFRSWSADDVVSSVEEIGNVATFLLSDLSSSINGSEIISDRAMSARLGAGLSKRK